MPPLTPLRFQPLLRRYVWGGHRLGSELGKPVGSEPCAESWEVCDREDGQTLVSAGPLAGTTLGTLVRERGGELLGRHHPRERFPLLFKFLDAETRLSLQVHPDDARARQLTPPECGKTEAWYVLDARPESVIYAGLRRGFDRATLARELGRGTAELCLHQISPRAGDCLFLPAGMVHALGGGLLVAELQQPSDVTYRLFDWNRVGPDGQPRPLHLESGLAALDDRLGPAEPIRKPLPTDPAGPASVERLISAAEFHWDRWSGGEPFRVGGDERFHLLAVVEGELDVVGDPGSEPLGRGGTVLVPASWGPAEIRPRRPVVVLDAYLP